MSWKSHHWVGPRACVKARRRARTRSQRAIDYARSGILHVAGETAFHDDERHRGRANARPMYRGDAARVFARANLLFATTTTPSAATCSSRCSSARGSTGGFPKVGAVSTTVGAGARVAHSVQRVCSRARGGFCCLARPARRATQNTAVISASSPGHGPLGWVHERGRDMAKYKNIVFENSTAQYA